MVRYFVGSFQPDKSPDCGIKVYKGQCVFYILNLISSTLKCLVGGTAASRLLQVLRIFLRQVARRIANRIAERRDVVYESVRILQY